MPDQVGLFLTESRWEGLRLEELRKWEREDVAGFLEDVFRREKPENWSREDISAAFRTAAFVADCYREPFDETGFTKADLIAAKQTADRLRRAERAR